MTRNVNVGTLVLQDTYAAARQAVGTLLSVVDAVMQDEVRLTVFRVFGTRRQDGVIT